MMKPEDLSHVEIPLDKFYAAVAAQENNAIEAANSDVFRTMFGDETADGVIALAWESMERIPDEYRPAD